MNHTDRILLIAAAAIFLLSACNLPQSSSTQAVLPSPLPSQQAEPTAQNTPFSQPTTQETSLPQPASQSTPLPQPTSAVSTALIQPAELEYLGAFRLPAESGTSSWEYSGRGLTYYPEGDPGSADDGFPGSLFGVGHDQQQHVSEISIPAPVNSRNLDDLNTAETLQPFADITLGMFGETEIPRLGIQYLPPQPGQSGGKIHFVHGQHFQDFQPSHGWSELTLSDPQSAGPWVFDGYTNYITNDYLLEIPPEWAVQIPGAPILASGRFREGVWGGRGPTLLAYNPLENGSPPAPDTSLQNITPLLLYGRQESGLTDILSDETTQMDLYNEDDSWWGSAWLTQGGRSAVIFVGTKATGRSWYGFANGVVWEYDCAEQNPPTCPEVPEWPYDARGYWAESYQPAILFYDPSDLVAVANGWMATWEPQPYAMLDLSAAFYDPAIRLEDYKTDLAGAVAYDRQRGLLYIIERLADGPRSVVHVWRIR